ncbi:MAG TPA: hypothetical protein VM580_15780 [Labilithrix sp.]|nr:hypothetical protein [Labilithrix sp.]
MSLSRFVIAGLLLSSVAASAGCASEEGAKEEVDLATTQSELKLSGVRYLGWMYNGETRTVSYSNPPAFRAYGFEARGGDEITVNVTSTWGDAMGWITDSTYEILAFNDDASSSTLNSRVRYKVPAGTPSTSYRIVFRDYGYYTENFTVSLSIRSTVTCSYSGKSYAVGATFPASDGCNTCTCNSTGSVTCTRLSCSCNPANEPWRHYVGTPLQCMQIRFTCPGNMQMFSNSCGCGCQYY